MNEVIFHQQKTGLIVRQFSLLILALYLPLLATGQQMITGKVISDTTQEPVPWANIGLTNGERGTVSNENGTFNLALSNPTDTILCSAIGYQTRQLTGQDLLRSGVITLTETTYSLPLIEVTPDMLTNQQIVLGAKLEKRSYSVSFGSNQLGAGVGALIDIEQPTYLQRAYFTLNHAKGDSLLFRVNLYAYDEKTGLGPSLLRENVIISAPQKRGTITADLSAYQLLLEGKVLLCLEWVKDDNGRGNQGITFRARKSRARNNMFLKRTSVALYRNMAQEYEGFPGTQLGFYLTGKRKQ